MNRFILFDAGDTFEGFNDRREMTFPSAIRKKAELFKEWPLPLEDRPQKIVELDHEAFIAFRAFRDEASKRCAGGEAIDTLWGRANQNALILAGLLAVGTDHKKPRVTKANATWAIQFMRWSISTWGARLEGSVSRNFTEANSKKIESIIKDARKYSAKAKKPTWKKLLSQGYMPKSFLVQKSRHLRGPELEEAIRSLEEGGLIGSGETDSGLEFYKWVGA
jgi:hypothetical protein